MLNSALITALMEQHGVTDESCANHIGVSRQMFNYIRRNVRSINADKLKMLADYLCVPVGDLYRKKQTEATP